MNPTTPSFVRLVPALALLIPSLAGAQPIAYVTNQALNVVHTFNTSGFVPLGNIPVGLAPTSIAIPTAGGFALVANKGSNSVSKIDLATATVVATIPVPGTPTQIAITPDGSKAYVVQSTNCPTPDPTPTPTPIGPTPEPTGGGPTTPPCTVAIVDTASDTVVGSVTVGRNPFGIAMAPNGAYVWVTNRDDNSVSVINTTLDTVVDVRPVGNTPEGIFVGFGAIYITNDASNSLSVYREVDFQPIATIATGAGPFSVAVSPDGKTAIVGNDSAGTASLINTGTNTLRSTVTVGSHPAGIAVTPDSTRAVVANSTSGTISIVPLKGGAATTISVLGSPTGVAITPAPFFSIKKTASPSPVAAGGSIVYTIDYDNRGSAHASGVTITDTVPPGLVFASATDGGGPSGSNVVWNIGNLGIGATGQVQVTFSVDSAITDGTVLENTVTIADGAGNQAQSGVQVPTRVPGGFGVNNALYYVKGGNPNRPRDVAKFRAEFDLPNGFANDGLTISWTNASQVLDVMTLPAGSMSGANDSRWRFAGRLADGTRATVRMQKRGSGYWKIHVTHARATLPVPTDSTILISGSFGSEVVASERSFAPKRSRPGTKKLAFRS